MEGKLPRTEPASVISRAIAWRRDHARGRFALAALLLASATVAAYVPAMANGFIWDDDSYVLKNTLLHDLTGLRRIWLEPASLPQYYPLVHTTYWIEHHLWGLKPLGYHVTNIVLHAASAVLLWRLLRRLSLPGAYFAAAVWALHPVCVESVAWITERKNVLSGTFYLLSVLTYFRFCGAGAEPAPRRRWGLYAASFGLFVAALLGKTVTASMPAVILVVLWWKRDRLRWAEVWPLLPMLAVGAAMGVMTAWLEVMHVGARGTEWAFSVVDRFLIAGRALWFYASKVFWPVNLTFIYERWRIDAGAWRQYLFPLGVVAVLAALWLARRPRGPSHARRPRGASHAGRLGKGPLAAALIFAGTLFPALGFLNVYPMRYSFVADHFQYLACIALVALSVAVITQVLARAKIERAAVRLPAALGLLVLLAALSWHHCLAYRNAETLYRDILAKNWNCPMAHTNLGVILYDRGEFGAAAPHFRESVRLRPDYANAYFNLAMVLTKVGRRDEATRHFTTALAIDPTFVKARYELACTLAPDKDEATARERQAAMRHLREILRLQPKRVDARNRLGVLLLNAGKSGEAARHFHEVLRLRPKHAEAHNHLGVVAFRALRHDQAEWYFRRAIELQADYADAHSNLGMVLLQKGRPQEAADCYRTAIELEDDHAEAHNNLALILASQGDRKGAIRHLRAAVRSRPRHPEAHFNLARVLAAEGSFREAAGEYQTVIQLSPDRVEAVQRLAWLLATCRDASVRDPATAVDLAERLCSGEGRNVHPFVDTLAAAYAAAGDFPKAVEMAEKAASLADQAGARAAADQYRKRLELYRAGRAYTAGPTPAEGSGG
jgi:Flp pilus assembly protein TadD